MSARAPLIAVGTSASLDLAAGVRDGRLAAGEVVNRGAVLQAASRKTAEQIVAILYTIRNAKCYNELRL